METGRRHTGGSDDAPRNGVPVRIVAHVMKWRTNGAKSAESIHKWVVVRFMRYQGSGSYIWKTNQSGSQVVNLIESNCHTLPSEVPATTGLQSGEGSMWEETLGCGIDDGNQGRGGGVGIVTIRDNTRGVMATRRRKQD